MSVLPSLGPRGEGWVVIQFLLLGLEAVAGRAGPAWRDPLLTAGAAIGGVVILGGFVLAIRGLIDLRGALTPFPHPRDGATLVEDGAYRLVRHPIYGGIVIGAAGYGLATASLPAIAGAAVLLGFFRLKSGREEVWLAARYAGYRGYASRTRRMIPFVY